MSAFRGQWKWPIVLGVVTVLGLLAALIGDGGRWRALSWLLLAVPLSVIAYCSATARALPRE